MSRALVVILVVLSSLCSAEEKVEPPSALFQLVGVCPHPEDPTRAAIVWRPEAPDVEPTTAMNVFKNLEGRDVNACLLATIDRDPEARALLDAYLKKEDGDGPSYAKTINAVFRAWVAAGFDGALTEVARDGQRGPEVTEFLEVCRMATGGGAPCPSSSASTTRDGSSWFEAAGR